MDVLGSESPGSKSAGTERWRSGPSRMGPDLTASIMMSGRVYPGKLYLYDVDTERVFPIVTGDGDSEVLLVDNNTVYYRSSDRLFSAPIENDHVGPPQLLVSDDVIRDAHWAFIKH